MSKPQATNYLPKTWLYIGYWDWECIFSKFQCSQLVGPGKEQYVVKERRERRRIFLPSSTYPKLGGKKKKNSNRASIQNPPKSITVALLYLLVRPSSVPCTDPTQAPPLGWVQEDFCCQACSPWLLHDTKVLNWNPSNWCCHLHPTFDSHLVHTLSCPHS